MVKQFVQQWIAKAGKILTKIGALEMAIKFDNRVSSMDIVAIVASFLVGFQVFFSQGSEIDKLRDQQKRLSNDVTKVENRSDRGDHEIVEQLKEQRKEFKGSFDKLETKLDRLIDRELRKNN